MTGIRSRNVRGSIACTVAGRAEMDLPEVRQFERIQFMLGMSALLVGLIAIGLTVAAACVG